MAAAPTVRLSPRHFFAVPDLPATRTLFHDGLIFLPHQGVVMGAVVIELDVPDDVRRGLFVADPLNVGNPIIDFLYIIIFPQLELIGSRAAPDWDRRSCSN